MTAPTKDWFAVDRSGLRDILSRRGVEFAVFELVQNAWDTSAKRVDVQLISTGKTTARLVVTDDDPDGFADLTHAFTLFAPSVKKSDATKRGRFNLGEKLVLALWQSATIASTKGTYYFDDQGRRFDKVHQLHGSTFDGVLKLTPAEVKAIGLWMLMLLPPTTCTTTYNGGILESRKPLERIDCVIETEVAREDGRLRRHVRRTKVAVYETRVGETGMIYEMGIPIVTTGDRWHYDVGQKVPLSLDRDNVTPTYLRTVRVLVFNALSHLITAEDALSAWGRDAAADPRVDMRAMANSIRARFGDKVVSFDPSDPEANKNAVAAGYVVLHSGNLSKEEWANVKQFGLVKPAGQVTPSAKAELSSPGAYKTMEPTPEMVRVGTYAQDLGEALMGIRPSVKFTNDSQANFMAAWYEPTTTLTLNVGRLGRRWFDNLDGNLEEVDWLLIHEFGHHYSSDHLSHEYHEACCRLGARMRLVGQRVLPTVAVLGGR